MAKLIPHIADRCQAMTDMGRFLPGMCASQPDSLSSAACVESIAGCHFCNTFKGFDGMKVHCGLFDDATASASCP